MWDPKPEAPPQIRGQFQAIPTAVDGIRFTEHLPRCAKLADRMAVLRSLTHADSNHPTAAHLVLTGKPTQGGREYPGFGSHMSIVLGPPCSQRKTHDCAFGSPFAAAAARARRRSGSATPSAVSPPTVRKSRRVWPSQRRSRLPVNESIFYLRPLM